MRINDPSIPPANGHCLLLSLPRELRDEIYVHAITYDAELMVTFKTACNPNRTKSKANPPIGIAPLVSLEACMTDNINPLRYVCRQISEETKDLEFKHNSIGFWSSNPENTVEQFTTLLSQASPERRNMLRHVILYEGSCYPYWIPHIINPTLIGFCLSHPTASISVRLLNHRNFLRFVLDAYEFMAYGTAFQYLLTRQFPDCLAPSKKAEAIELAGSRQVAMKRSSIALPINLKVFPSRGYFNEASFRAKVQATPNWYNLSPEDIEQWILQAQRWCEHGYN